MILTPIAAAILLVGCQTTQPTPHVFDAAATIADADTPSATAEQPAKAQPKIKQTVEQVDFESIVTQSWRFRNNLDDNDKEINLDQLEDLSPAALLAKHQQHLKFIAQLDAIDRSSLSQQQDINWQILRGQLQELADSYSYNQHYMPLTSEYGFHVEVAGLSNQFAFKTLADYENYLGKLSQVSR